MVRKHDIEKGTVQREKFRYRAYVLKDRDQMACVHKIPICAYFLLLFRNSEYNKIGYMSELCVLDIFAKRVCRWIFKIKLKIL